MSPRLLRPRSAAVAGDSDVINYIAAVEIADGQQLEQGVKDAIRDFILGCKTDGIWSAIKASCILMGARTLSGALTPLVGAAPTNNNFVSADYNRKTGLVGNASTKSLNSNRNNNADPQNSFHAAVWVATAATTANQAYVGAGAATNETGASNFGRGNISGGSTFFRCRASLATEIAGAPTGFIGVARSISSEFTYRFNSGTATLTIVSQTPTSANLFVFSSTNTAFPTNARLAYYSIGESLTLATLDSRLTTLYNAIGAAIVPQVSNAEAQDWLNRVYDNGGTVSQTTANAVNTFCNSIDAAGIRDKFYRLNLFCGDQLAAALVPLYRAESRTASARGNSTDTNNGPFVSGDYNNTGASSGLKGNGTSKFLNTGVNGNTLNGNNLHYGFGLRSTQTGGAAYRALGGVYDGVFPGGFVYDMSVRRNDPGNHSSFGRTQASDTAGEQVSSSSLAVGDLVMAYPSFYRNGSASGATATASGNYPSAHPIYIFALNQANTTVNYTDSRMNWYSIGLTMTAAQVLSFTNAVAAFNTALSRT